MVFMMRGGLPRLLLCCSLAIFVSSVLSTPIDDAIAHLDSLSSKTASSSSFLANRYPITYELGRQSQLLNFARKEYVIPVLWGNVPMGSAVPLLAAVGKDPVSNTRYAAWASNPFSNSKNKPSEANVIDIALDTIAWALGDANYASVTATSTRTVTLSFVRGLSLWNTSTDSVFKRYFPNWTVIPCEEESELASCLAQGSAHFAGASTDTADRKAVADIFKARMDAGHPYMFFHDNYWGNDLAGSSGAVGLTFPYAGIYFYPQTVNIPDANAVSSYVQANYEFGDIKSLLIRVRDSTFTWNIAQCSDEDCSGDPRYQSELLKSASSIRSMIEAMEENGFSPLDDVVGSPMMNKLVLAGDYLRVNTRYPLNTTHSSTTWSKAILADALYTQLRATGQPQSYLGTFGKTIDNSVPRISKSLTLQTRNGRYTTSAGIFAAPGDTITITRTDSSELKNDQVRVFVNQIRTNSYPIRDQQLTRPYWLWGNAIPVPASGSVSINSAYGGIIYVTVPEGATWHSNIQLSFTNVVQHPVYVANSGQNAQTWVTDVNADIFGWAEILHPHIQLHLQSDYAKSFVSEFTDIDLAMSDYEKYIYNYHYKMAGFWSAESTITPLPGVAAKAASFGLRGLVPSAPQNELVSIQHMNTDGYSVCGDGCSGNPIDMRWSFSNYGWGEHHELGHNIQYGRFKINGGDSTEVSNNIFPLSVNFKISFDDTRNLGSVGSVNGIRRDSENAFQKMRDAAQSGRTPQQVGLDPAQLCFYTTLILSSADNFGEHGFEMVPMLYMMSRSIDAETNWTAARDNYGLSLYDSIDEIDGLQYPGNDFLLLAVSWLNQLDYRSFFWSWGATWSPKVNDQINAWHLDRKAPNFTYPTDNYTAFDHVFVDSAMDPYAGRAVPQATGTASMLSLSFILASLLSLLALVSL